MANIVITACRLTYVEGVSKMLHVVLFDTHALISYTADQRSVKSI